MTVHAPTRDVPIMLHATTILPQAAAMEAVFTPVVLIQQRVTLTQPPAVTTGHANLRHVLVRATSTIQVT